jgi:hydrogenase maturation protease
MKRLVIGLGHPFRGDDAAGLEVADRVRTAESRKNMTGSFELMDLWAEADDVIIVDATRSNSPAGTIHRFNPVVDSLPRGTFASTHAIGVAETIELARRLDRLPKRLVIFGIEAGSFANGTELSPAVAEAIEKVTREIDDA